MTALHLLRLGRLIAEAVDEDFQLLDAIYADCGRQPAIARCAAFSGIEICRSCRYRTRTVVPDFRDFVDRYVEKITVVRDQHKGMGIIVQILLPSQFARSRSRLIGGSSSRSRFWLLLAATSLAPIASASRRKIRPSAAPNLLLRKPKPIRTRPTSASIE